MKLPTGCFCQQGVFDHTDVFGRMDVFAHTTLLPTRQYCPRDNVAHRLFFKNFSMVKF
jgi:hypothetical protein